MLLIADSGITENLNRRQWVEEWFGQRQKARVLSKTTNVDVEAKGTDCDQRPALSCPAASGPGVITRVGTRRNGRSKTNRSRAKAEQSASAGLGDPATLERA
jgi:hypothetical protein